MPDVIRVACVQMTTRDDKAANLERAEGLVARAAATGADVVVLPEKWNAIGRAATYVQAAETLAEGEAVEAMARWARTHGITLVGGSITERRDGREKLSNTSIVFDPQGSVVAATIGVAPYLQRLDPREPAPASPIAWLGFFGPALAVVLVTRFVGLLPAESGPGYAVLLALGIFNLVLGAFGAWQSKPNADLWRYSFIGEWGLVLVGFGLLNSTAAGGAYLLLVSILLLRLPLYLLARPALIQAKPVATITPLTLLVAAALFGSAPFAGFPARLLLIRGATQVPWPLTVLLVLVMLSWLPQSLRLAQTLGRPSGRLAAGVVIVLLLNLALGLYPNLVLNLLGVR